MEDLLNKGIKEIIDQHPDVEKVLDNYGIGCGPCSVGICQLKDIVEIHNAKEEDILFEYFDKDSEILQVMYEDHTTGRGHVKAMLAALERRDKETLARHLLAYRELLTGHIQKEDEILFPWMDRNLSTTQVGELFAKFNELDEKMGFSPDKYLNFIEKLVKQFNVQEKKNG